jgi:hypothetical protein
MSQDTTMIADINEAAHLIETYHLSSLIWRFEDCPLSEVKHYVPAGKEELVVVCHKDDTYLTYRLVFDGGNYDVDKDDYRITLNFHPVYHIFIILNPDGKADEKDAS